MTLINENWKPVKGYEGVYEINEFGTIRSLHKKYLHKELKQRTNKSGYLIINLKYSGKSKTYIVHRLVASIFLENKENKCCVNHKDGIKSNNHISNLEWVSNKENMNHAYSNELITIKKVINICTGEVFSSAKEAAIMNNLNLSTLRCYLSGHNINTTCLNYAA